MKNDDRCTELNIQELIVVEGKNDAHVIRKALGKVDVIWTEGFGLTEEKLNLIAVMAERRGVIVCTDPDFAGKLIRERIKRKVPNTKHVYLSRKSATNGKGDIGLENVSVEEVRRAFTRILIEQCSDTSDSKQQQIESINMADLIDSGLVGQEGSADKRAALGKLLGIGDTNAKQFLFRINRYALSRKDFFEALKVIERVDE